MTRFKLASLLKERLQRAADAVGSWTGKVTGVQRLETLKANVQIAYQKLNDAKSTFHSAKDRYYNIVELRRTCQVSVNNLLQRKSVWTAHDVEEFTKAISQEHVYEGEEKNAKQKLTEAEQLIEKLQEGYEDIVRERYQEELLVAERNRGMSNILTWSLMLANLSMFAVSQLIVEPFRRKNIQRTVQVEVETAMKPIQTSMNSMMASLSVLSDELKSKSKPKSLDEIISKTPSSSTVMSSNQNKSVSWIDNEDIQKVDVDKKLQEIRKKNKLEDEKRKRMEYKAISENNSVVSVTLFFGIMVLLTLLKRS